MGVENEFNYCLHDPRGRLEARLRSMPAVRRLEMRQGYLSNDLRIRAMRDAATGDTEFVMSFKRSVDGRVVEVETPMDEADFRRLWKTCETTLRKTRYAYAEGDVHWDVDYFRTRKGETYFVKAEAEVGADVTQCPDPSPALRGHVIAVPGKRKGFSSRRLADEAYARPLLKGLLERYARRVAKRARNEEAEPAFRMAA
jgi:CYTH domain-containing protein